jgi:hypothetical protein
VRFPKDQYFHRKRTINLSEPYDKRLTADVTSNWELERYGLLTWDSQFVILRVNGEVLGLFQEIEQFGETIPARNRRSEGYIFSGLGQLFGNEGANFDQATHAIDLVRQCFADESGNVGQHCQDWSYASDYFDTDRWAWAAALTAVVKSRHAWAPDNLRLFWDPARGKFEPIPWDYLFFAIDPRTDVEGEADYSGYLVESFLRIPEFRRMRDRRLWFLVSERVDKMIDHADGLFDELTEALARDVRHLSFEYDIKEHREITDGLRNNKKILMELFQKHDLEARYWPAGDGVLTVELWNHGKSFLSVDTVVLEVDGASTRQQLEHPVVVDGLWQGAPGRAVLSVPAPDGAKLIDLTVRDEVTSSDLSGDEIRIRQADGQAPEIPSPDVSPPLETALKRVRVEPSRVTFGPGRVELEGVLEIPRSHEVVFAPGLDLRMGDGAGLMIYGNLSSVGTAAAPVRISGQWPGTVWGGIFVQGTRTSPSLVRVEHTIIEGGSGGENERTRFSSPFSVHDGTVVVRASEFRNSATEDGVNLKYVRTVVERIRRRDLGQSYREMRRQRAEHRRADERGRCRQRRERLLHGNRREGSLFRGDPRRRFGPASGRSLTVRQETHLRPQCRLRGESGDDRGGLGAASRVGLRVGDSLIGRRSVIRTWVASSRHRRERAVCRRHSGLERSGSSRRHGRNLARSSGLGDAVLR